MLPTHLKAYIQKALRPREEKSNPRIRASLASAFLLGICTLGYYSRCPTISLQPSLYAEDGTVFLQQAIDQGMGSLIELYAGYSHLLQRITALTAVNFLSPVSYPLFFLLVAWASYLLPLISTEALIRTGVLGKLMRAAYIPYVYYPYAAETYLNLPNSYIFFPLGYIIISYGVVAKQGGGELPRVFDSRLTKWLLLIYGLVSAFTGPFVAIYTIPLLIFHSLRIGRLAIRPVWLSLPILLSCLQIFFSQMQTFYPLSTVEAAKALLSRPHLLLNWFTVHLICPLLGGYKAWAYIQTLPQFKQILIVMSMLALIAIALKVVMRRIAQPGVLALAVLCTMGLSVSSLLISVRRGSDLNIMAMIDIGGRFYYWNTILFLSILIMSFIILVQRPRSRFHPACIALATWGILTYLNYYNNFAPRPISASDPTGESNVLIYQKQLEAQCSSSKSLPIQIFPGPGWSFMLGKSQLAKLCSDLS